MAETPNYNLRYPVGTDPVDVAGDIANLASDVDTAISINWDTATQEQKDAVADRDAPVTILGSGRPDGNGNGIYATAIDAPTGSYFHNNQARADQLLAPNMGARIWCKSDIYWVLVSGNTGTYNLPTLFGQCDASGYHRVIRTSQGVRYMLHRWTGGPPPDGGAVPSKSRPYVIDEIVSGWRVNVQSPIAGAYGSDGIAPTNSFKDWNGVACGQGSAVALGNNAGTGFSSTWPVSVFMSNVTWEAWPTQPPHTGASKATVSDEKKRIESLIKEHPELEEELRAELEVFMRSNDE